jgi:MFS family permease
VIKIKLLMNQTTEEKVLNPTVVKLGMVSLFADISSEMLYPITPIFLTSVLGASMTSVGLIEGVAEAIASLLKTYAGAWSDRISKRKPFIIFGYFLAAVAKPLIGGASSWMQVLFARGIDRTGKGLRTAPRDAMLAESVSPKLRGAAFGWHRGMDTMGAAIGPLLAILYLSYGANNLRRIYYWALVPGLFAVIISLLIKEEAHVVSSIRFERKTLRWNSFSTPFKTYLLSSLAFSLTNSSDIFLLMKAKQEGLSLQIVILLYCFYNLVYSLMSPYLGGLSDRIGRKKLLLSGFAIFSLVYLGFALAVSLWHFWLLFGIYGLYMAATDGNGKAFAIDLVKSDEKATGLGVLGTITGVATVAASTIAGALWEHAGSSWAFVYGVIGALTAAAILAFVPEKNVDQENLSKP